MKRLRGKMLARHSVDAQYDAIYILGFRFLARKRNCSMTQKSSFTYAEELPVKRTKILLRSDGNNYSGAPKYIANEIIRRKLPWELVWIVDKNVLIYQDDFPPSIRLDMIGTPESRHGAAHTASKSSVLDETTSIQTHGNESGRTFVKWTILYLILH